MYTRHGHHIPGTRKTGTPPKEVARCGGPRLCTICSREANANRPSCYKEEPTAEELDAALDVVDDVWNALFAAGLSADKVARCVKMMQDRGIMFVQINPKERENQS